MFRIPLAMLAAIAMFVADLAPRDGGFSPVSTAWADDDDDDDAQPRRRRPAPAARPRAAPPPPPFAPDEVIARGMSENDLQALREAGFREIRRRTLADGQTFLRLRKPARLTLPQARDMVRARASVQVADLNHYFRPEQAPACAGTDCPLRHMIDWPGDTSGCGTPPRIGMVDTGLNDQHPVLSSAQLRLHRLETGQGQKASDRFHGTSVAALLVGEPGSRTPGLVPQANLIAVDAFHKAGTDERADAYALIEALDYLAAEGVQVINLSLAGPFNFAVAGQVLELDRRGIVLVAAAGNGGPSAKPAYPAAHKPVIAVTAVDRRGQVYRRAGRGAHIDLAAPGVEVWTAASIRGAKTQTGTSYAAPFVTAAVALMLQKEPGLTPAQVRARLQASTRDLGPAGHDEVFGHGLILPVNPCE
ncbi:S8 family serine peptidase [Paracoccus lutimaris]|uniref:Subtilase family protein n=1 Tax=Paracoccus lutimaris TaxID=1490030 RepID=A0A368Z3V6_9RHOB|nr:S8 family serine peptidase [Paracoccus lutimaris]RCW87140.1 subtilase family protein [Paracoccus lutimaris]